MIAAWHLDQLQSQLPAIEQLTGGSQSLQRQYLRDKLQQINAVIQEEINNIQCHKADLL